MATKLDVYQEAARILGDARLVTLTDDVELRYILDDAYARAVEDVLRRANWRFALVTAALAPGSGTALPGFGQRYAYPAGWLRTAALFLPDGARECPFDLREMGTLIHAAETGAHMRYVSTDGAAEAKWSVQFTACVAAFLAFSTAERVTNDPARTKATYSLFEARLAEAIALDAEPDSPWLWAQRDGTFLRVAREMLGRAFWRFSLVTTATLTNGAPAPGFALGRAIPADHARTQALFLQVGGAERPLDVREQAGIWSFNAGDLVARYVSTARGLDSRLWPESYGRAVLAMLGLYRGGGEGASETAQALLGAAIGEHAVPPSPWLAAQLSGRFPRIVARVLELGFWRFALKTAALPANGTAFGGFARGFNKPADWMRTHSAFVRVEARERPVPLREQGAGYASDATALTIRYTSAAALDASLWPDGFEAAALASARADGAQGEERSARLAEMREAVTVSLATDGVPDDPWYPFQITDQFQRTVATVLGMGFWRFALRMTTFSDSVGGSNGYLRTFTKRDDHLWTHSAFVSASGREYPVDLHEETFRFSTDASRLTVRYSSTDALSALTWPDSFADAVLAALRASAAMGDARAAAERAMRAAVDASLASDGVAPSPWYRFQKTDAFRAAAAYVLGHGRWRFASKSVALAASGTPQAGMSYRYPLPTDFLRTINVGTPRGDDLADVDWHEEGGAIHSDASPAVLRYVSTVGLSALEWPEAFRDAVLAYLEYGEARDAPDRAPEAERRLALFRDRLKSAETKDDQRDRPRINQIGRFVRARGGRIGGEQGHRWP